jgi:chitin disaccharide deacetylase
MNSALRHLGFGPRDRVVIIHADDIGMCQATLPALADLLDFGLLSSAAVMVPCPWFPAAAAFCRAHPVVDMGVHLTLNAEWSTYRWGPVASVVAWK